MEVKGLNKENIIKISDYKKEDNWVKEFRLKSFDAFSSMGDQLPFGPPFSLDFDKIIYYKSQEDTLKDDWNQVLKPVRDELSALESLRVKRIWLEWVFNMKVKLFIIK